MKLTYYKLTNLLLILLVTFSCNTPSETSINKDEGHPKLILTKEGVKQIRAELGSVPLFDKSLEVTKAEVDKEIEQGIDIPIPKDYSGGYTHSRHKRNFIMMQKAGVLYQILEDDKYAIYVKDMLLEYAKMYPTLPIHPKPRSYARGKIFWQCLNDSNWLVYTSQAYDCIYSFLTEEEREVLENDLFIPFAKFISEGNPQFFNRVHNHSTWGNVAVGMIALVMDNDELLQNALNGLKTDNLEVGMKDNDGGFIKVEGQKVGFLANLEEPFSPDGYYTEGPYYQRYAMYPFLIFAEALENVKPEMKVFAHKDSVLLKSVNTLLNLTDADGEFFPLNDGQKGMSYYSRELVTAVDIAYKFGGENPELLSVAEKQGKVTLDDAGFAIAKGIKDGKAKPFSKNSINLSDGSDGTEGGVGILRSDEIEVVFKYAAQGLSHGHYDKLSFSMYEDGNEIIQDYGLARFVNIEQKGGGNYLKENTTWAKQTIAHNTLVQDGESHFKGKYEIGSKHASELYFYDDSVEEIQIVSATEENAYPGTKMHRTMTVIKNENFEKPIVLDVMKVNSDKKHQYEMPFYYLGHIMKTNFTYSTPKVFKSIGTENGYQHLINEGSGDLSEDNLKFSWKNYNKFFSLTSVVNSNDQVVLARIGANDPDFNLRKDPALIFKRPNEQNTTFVSVIESHGSYSPVSEFAVNTYSSISKVSIELDSDDYTAIIVEHVKGKKLLVILSNKNASNEANHTLEINNTTYSWVGPYNYKIIN